MAKSDLKEHELADDYPIYAGYVYVVDGEPKVSPIEGNVKQLKSAFDATSVKNCDLVARHIL